MPTDEQLWYQMMDEPAKADPLAEARRKAQEEEEAAAKAEEEELKQKTADILRGPKAAAKSLAKSAAMIAADPMGANPEAAAEVVERGAEYLGKGYDYLKEKISPEEVAGPAAAAGFFSDQKIKEVAEARQRDAANLAKEPENIQRFFGEYEDRTNPHMVDERYRVWEHGQTAVFPGEDINRMVGQNISDAHLEMMTVFSDQRGSGRGSEILQDITDNADRNNIRLSLEVTPEDRRRGGGGLSPEETVEWYKRHGFEVEMADPSGSTLMVRQPKEAQSPRAAAPVESLFSDRALDRARTYSYPSHKSKDLLVYLTPEEFLGLAEQGHSPEKESRVRSMVEAGEKFEDVPHLRMDDSGQVLSHEGRHRVQELQRLGYDRIPVLLESRGIRWSEQAEGGKERLDYVKELPKQLTGEDGTFKVDSPFHTEGELRGQPLESRGNPRAAAPETPRTGRPKRGGQGTVGTIGGIAGLGIAGTLAAQAARGAVPEEVRGAGVEAFYRFKGGKPVEARELDPKSKAVQAFVENEEALQWALQNNRISEDAYRTLSNMRDN